MKLVIPCKDTIHIIKQRDVVYCRSDNAYSLIFLANGEKLTLPKSLTKLNALLAPEIFLKINQSYVVNMEFVKRIGRRDKIVELTGSQKIRFTIKLNVLLNSLSKVNGVEVLDSD